MTLEELLDAWRVNNAVNLEILAAIADEDFELKPGKGKTIRSNFVHIIGVRRMLLEEKMPKEAATVPKLDWKSAPREDIQAALEHSSKLMQHLFTLRESKPGKGAWTTLKFFAYCVAHEAHHRSQIELTMRLNGKEFSDEFGYSLWEWAKK